MSKVTRLLASICIFVLLFLPGSRVSGRNTGYQTRIDKPPDVIQGGEWKDDFWIGELQEAENIDIQTSHLLLKSPEQLHWIQTWTAHFASGEFFQTEAISDSVRLAWNESNQSFFTSGIYTSTVFYAGKPVDWAFSEWWYSGVPEGVIVQFRTGNTPSPDISWTSWMIPRKGNFQYICAFTYPSEITQCFNNMGDIISSPYIQYRATFDSNDPSKTIEFFDIDLLYGVHSLSGSATSILITPVDLREWESVILTSTAPVDTTLVIDVLAPDGMVLMTDVKDGTSLKEINSLEYPALQLRVSFYSADESITPDVDLWGFKWSVWNRQYLSVVLR